MYQLTHGTLFFVRKEGAGSIASSNCESATTSPGAPSEGLADALEHQLDKGGSFIVIPASAMTTTWKVQPRPGASC